MVSGDEADFDLEIKRPRRSCTQKEIEQQEKFEDSDIGELSEDFPDNPNDEDFTLNRPKRKPIKKKKKRSKKEMENKKLEREFDYFSVMRVHGALEQKYAQKSQIVDTDEYSSGEDWSPDDDVVKEEEKEVIKEPTPEPPPTEQTKKKKIVIRPWNPMWYKIQQ